MKNQKNYKNNDDAIDDDAFVGISNESKGVVIVRGRETSAGRARCLWRGCEESLASRIPLEAHDLVLTPTVVVELLCCRAHFRQLQRLQKTRPTFAIMRKHFKDDVLKNAMGDTEPIGVTTRDMVEYLEAEVSLLDKNVGEAGFELVIAGIGFSFQGTGQLISWNGHKEEVYKAVNDSYREGGSAVGIVLLLRERAEQGGKLRYMLV